MNNMKRSKIPLTDINISELSFGAWAIGGNAYGRVELSDSYETICSYIDLGGNFIDTAIKYGDSEKILGDVLKKLGKTNNLIIASKTPNGTSLDNIDNIEKDLDITLKLLNRSYLDLYYLHVPPEDDKIIEVALGKMLELKKAGKIRAIGASIKGVNVTQNTVDLCKKYIDTGKINAIQLVYSMLRQKNADIFDVAEKNKVAIIGRTALESGFLTGKFNYDIQFPPTDHRNRWNKNISNIIEAANEIESFAVKAPFENLSQTAIKFAMQPRAIISTIVGAKNKRQMLNNIAASMMPELDYDITERIIAEYGEFNNKANTN